MGSALSICVSQFVQAMLPAWVGGAFAFLLGVVLLALAAGFPRRIVSGNKELREFYAVAGRIPGRLMLVCAGLALTMLPFGWAESRLGVGFICALAAVFLPCALGMIVRLLIRSMGS